MRTGLATIASLVLTSALGAQQPQPCPVAGTSSARTEPALARRVDSMLTAFLRAERIPGASVGVVRCGRTLVAKGYGMADLEHGAKATPATLFRLASVSKPFAAVLGARLAEQGRMDLDAPIQRYVPSFPDKGAPLTARQLMSHTAGIRAYRGDEIASTRHYATLGSALAIFAADSLVHPPGAGYTYSTYGYTLLGVAQEAACGATWMACLQAEVLQPAGIRDVREDRLAEVIRDRARPYALDGSKALQNAGPANTSYKIPGGGLIATGEAVARFGDASMRGVLVKPATWARMTAPVRTSDGKVQNYGEGWNVGGGNGLLDGVVSHTGSQQGTSTVLYLLPSQGLSVAILTNLENVGGRKLMLLADAIARAASVRVAERRDAAAPERSAN